MVLAIAKFTGFQRENTMRVYVNTEDKRWKKYKINFEKIANATVGSKYKNAEVSITLVDDKYIKKVNKKYRGINKPTNVLSFELGDNVLLGDIFISIDTVSREAKNENISVAEHTAHMVVHGILHLLGYDHINDKDAEKMEKKETIILRKLGYKNPYTAESVVCNDVPVEKQLVGYVDFLVVRLDVQFCICCVARSLRLDLHLFICGGPQ